MWSGWHSSTEASPHAYLLRPTAARSSKWMHITYIVYRWRAEHVERIKLSSRADTSLLGPTRSSQAKAGQLSARFNLSYYAFSSFYLKAVAH